MRNLMNGQTDPTSLYAKEGLSHNMARLASGSPETHPETVSLPMAGARLKSRLCRVFQKTSLSLRVEGVD
jgi:hypothetical protein